MEGGVKTNQTDRCRMCRTSNREPSNTLSQQSGREGVLLLTAPPRASEYINHCGPRGGRE